MKSKRPFSKRNTPLTRRMLVQTIASSPFLFFVKPSFGQSSDEVNAIIKDLAPIQGQIKAGERYRPVRPETYTWQGRNYCVDKEYSRDFEVYFDFDSSQITPTARDQLNGLGGALQSELTKQYRYVLCGHTDKKGAFEYNMDLSLRRAEAVLYHLLNTFAIDPYRIEVIPFGYTKLKRPETPYAAINRRVEVTFLVDNRMC